MIKCLLTRGSDIKFLLHNIFIELIYTSVYDFCLKKGDV